MEVDVNGSTALSGAMMEVKVADDDGATGAQLRAVISLLAARLMLKSTQWMTIKCVSRGSVACGAVARAAKKSAFPPPLALLLKFMFVSPFPPPPVTLLLRLVLFRALLSAVRGTNCC